MNYLFLGKNNESSDLYFKTGEDQFNFMPINIISENEEIIINNEKIINIYFDYHKNSIGCIYPIDYDYIFEYYIKNKKNTFNFLDMIAEVNKLYASLRYLTEEKDIIITENSSHYLSRTIHESCIQNNSKCFFVENSFINKFYKISQKPYVQSKHGNTELFDKFMENEQFQDMGLLSNILRNPILGIDDMNFTDKEYDILIIGENENSDKFVLVEKEFKDMEEMCLEIISQNPNSSIAYRPETVNLDIPKIDNLDIVYNNIDDLFTKVNKVYTINSDIGIFAELSGKDVVWMSNTENKQFNLKENGEKFLSIYMDLCFKHKKLLSKLNIPEAKE